LRRAVAQRPLGIHDFVDLIWSVAYGFALDGVHAKEGPRGARISSLGTMEVRCSSSFDF